MCIFQSEQVIKLRNVLVSLETMSDHQVRQISNNWIIMWETLLGCYQKFTQNCPNCGAEDCLAMDME